MTQPVIRRITARDGTRLAVRDWPSGGKSGESLPPVLCLCGITRNGKDFDRLAADLSAKGHRTLVLDYRGRGLSERAKDPMSYVPIVYLDDIRNVLAGLGLHHVVVIGTSLGGFLAMGMAVLMPTVIKGIVLNDAGPDVPTAGLDKIVNTIAEAKTYADWDGAIGGVKLMLPDLNQDPVGWRLAAEGCFKEENGRVVPDWDPGIAVPFRQRNPTPPLWPLYSALRPFPVLAFRGAVSPFLSSECFAKMKAVKPDLQQAEIADRGHTPTLDEPESRAALETFLEDIR